MVVADFAITQPVYEPQVAREFLDTYANQFGPLELPVLAGTLPLYSVRHAHFLHNEVPGIHIPDAVLKRIQQAGEIIGNSGRFR